MAISFNTVAPALSEELASSENITGHHSSNQIINVCLIVEPTCVLRPALVSGEHINVNRVSIHL